MAEYTVTFNFSGLHLGFSSRTGRILERAAFILTEVEGAERNAGLVPKVQGPAIPVQLTPRPLLDVQKESERWVITSALRDCIEEVSLFMEKTRELCAAVMLFESGSVPAERWNESVVKPARAFGKKNFPDKIEFLRSEYGADLLPPIIDYISTLNAARNCLVHRHGVVGVEDCKLTDCLTVKWRSFELHGRDADGNEFPLVVSQTLKAQTQVLMRHGTVERVFTKGDTISFSPGDLSGIWLTLHFFGVATASNVEKLAKAKGLVTEEAQEPGDNHRPVADVSPADQAGGGTE